jgi:glycerophosphoryl diester phosphodiesterase
VVGIAVGAILLGAVPILAVYSDLEVKQDVQVTAHRGSSLRAPENSLAAIAAAIEDGADYAEIDVQETADGEIVLLHDLDLLRVTGVNRKIWEVELAELQELDAGSWFSPEFADERIPTLQQAIDLAGEKIRLNIELKYNGHEPNLSRRVVEIVREKGIGSRCVLSSLSLKGLQEVEALAPELETGLIVGASIGNLTRLEVDFFSVNASRVNWPLAAELRDAGKELHAWTVNDTGEMWRLLTLGVDNLITDVPPDLLAARAEFAELSPVEILLIAFHHRIAE